LIFDLVDGFEQAALVEQDVVDRDEIFGGRFDARS